MPSLAFRKRCKLCSQPKVKDGIILNYPSFEDDFDEDSACCAFKYRDDEYVEKTTLSRLPPRALTPKNTDESEVKECPSSFSDRKKEKPFDYHTKLRAGATIKSLKNCNDNNQPDDHPCEMKPSTLCRDRCERKKKLRENTCQPSGADCGDKFFKASCLPSDSPRYSCTVPLCDDSDLCSDKVKSLNSYGKSKFPGKSEMSSNKTSHTKVHLRHININSTANEQPRKGKNEVSECNNMIDSTGSESENCNNKLLVINCHFNVHPPKQTSPSVPKCSPKTEVKKCIEPTPLPLTCQVPTCSSNDPQAVLECPPTEGNASAYYDSPTKNIRVSPCFPPENYNSVPSCPDEKEEKNPSLSRALHERPFCQNVPHSCEMIYLPSFDLNLCSDPPVSRKAESYFSNRDGASCCSYQHADTCQCPICKAARHNPYEIICNEHPDDCRCSLCIQNSFRDISRETIFHRKNCYCSYCVERRINCRQGRLPINSYCFLPPKRIPPDAQKAFPSRHPVMSNCLCIPPYHKANPCRDYSLITRNAVELQPSAFDEDDEGECDFNDDGNVVQRCDDLAETEGCKIEGAIATQTDDCATPCVVLPCKNEDDCKRYSVPQCKEEICSVPACKDGKINEPQNCYIQAPVIECKIKPTCKVNETQDGCSAPGTSSTLPICIYNYEEIEMPRDCKANTCNMNKVPECKEPKVRECALKTCAASVRPCKEDKISTKIQSPKSCKQFYVPVSKQKTHEPHRTPNTSSLHPRKDNKVCVKTEQRQPCTKSQVSTPREACKVSVKLPKSECKAKETKQTECKYSLPPCKENCKTDDLTRARQECTVPVCRDGPSCSAKQPQGPCPRPTVPVCTDSDDCRGKEMRRRCRKSPVPVCKDTEPCGLNETQFSTRLCKEEKVCKSNKTRETCIRNLQSTCPDKNDCNAGESELNYNTVSVCKAERDCRTNSKPKKCVMETVPPCKEDPCDASANRPSLASPRKFSYLDDYCSRVKASKVLPCNKTDNSCNVGVCSKPNIEESNVVPECPDKYIETPSVCSSYNENSNSANYFKSQKIEICGTRGNLRQIGIYMNQHGGISSTSDEESMQQHLLQRDRERKRIPEQEELEDCRDQSGQSRNATPVQYVDMSYTRPGVSKCSCKSNGCTCECPCCTRSRCRSKKLKDLRYDPCCSPAMSVQRSEMSKSPVPSVENCDTSRRGSVNVDSSSADEFNCKEQVIQHKPPKPKSNRPIALPEPCFRFQKEMQEKSDKQKYLTSPSTSSKESVPSAQNGVPSCSENKGYFSTSSCDSKCLTDLAVKPCPNSEIVPCSSAIDASMKSFKHRFENSCGTSSWKENECCSGPLVKCCPSCIKLRANVKTCVDTSLPEDVRVKPCPSHSSVVRPCSKSEHNVPSCADSAQRCIKIERCRSDSKLEQAVFSDEDMSKIVRPCPPTKQTPLIIVSDCSKRRKVVPCAQKHSIILKSNPCIQRSTKAKVPRCEDTKVAVCCSSRAKPCSVLATEMSVILVIGGITSVDRRATDRGGRNVWKLLTERMTWKEATPLPEPRHNHGAAVIHQTVYVTGGINPCPVNGCPLPTDTTYICCLSDQKWRIGPPLSQARSHHACTVFWNKVWILGGKDACGRFLDCVEYLDIFSQQWMNAVNLPSCRAGLASAVNRQKLYVVGGNSYIKTSRKERNLYQPVECYSFFNSQWHCEPALPTGCFCACLEVANGYLFLLGGAQMDQDYDDPEMPTTLSSIYVLNDSSRTWNCVNRLCPPRYNMGSAVIDSKIFLIGGITVDRNSNHVSVLDSGVCFDVAYQELSSPTFSLPSPLTGCSCVVFKEKCCP